MFAPKSRLGRPAARIGDVTWDDKSVRELTGRYGRDLADDLLYLGTLYTAFEARSGYPWPVCNAALDEAKLLQGEKGERFRHMIDFLSEHQVDWCSDTYPGIAKGLLTSTRGRRQGCSRPPDND